MDVAALLTKYMESESSMYFAKNMSSNYKNELLKIYRCEDDYSANDILGNYENPMKLGAAIISSLRKKPSKAGVLFLKDAFIYRENTFSEVMRCCYSEIGNVYISSFGVSIYISNISNEIRLKGIGYADPAKIGYLFKEICKNNKDTFLVTRQDRRRKAINKGVNIVASAIDNMILEGYQNKEKCEREYQKKRAEYQQKIDSYEKKVKKYEAVNGVSQKTIEGRQKIEAARAKLSSSGGRVRKTDSDFENSVSKANEGSPRDYQYRSNIPLSIAIDEAASKPGVYVLILNGKVMKCGRAAYGQGIRWRLRQYYNLNYDNKAREGQHWSVSNENKDDIRVSWQCCPASRCQELEYKLFQKYGKGPWARRAPSSIGNNDDWELLI